ncbi:MAG: 16S rRNA (uracil(1498)-N(3))-methyltransferase [Rhodospirillales bacterium]|nr:16S rRNA (uracil(1498)-N(3))-methyltransferase [Rhodospirillales bacterium]
MSRDQNKVRLHVDQSLSQGQNIDLDRDQSHYVAHVMRQGVGNEISLFNGRDGEWRAAVSALARNQVTVACLGQSRKQKKEPDLWLLFAPLKKSRIDFVVEKATELGVSRLLPVLTERTVVTRINRHRLLARAIEAAEQSERLSIPQIDPEIPLSELISRWDQNRLMFVMDETGGGEPIRSTFSKLPPGKNGSAPLASILIGPEGGFSPSELDGLKKQPFVTPVTAGPRILRAETAAVAALACWQAFAGDW